MSRQSRLLAYGLPTLAAMALVGAAFTVAKSMQTRPTLEPRQFPPLQPAMKDWGGSLRGILIGAAGIVEPSGQEVRIGTDVSGSVEQVLIEPGSYVRRGDPLLIIDRRVAQATLEQRQRDLAVAQSRLEQARARLAGLEAEVQIAHTAIEVAQAEKDDASDLARSGNLLQGGAAISDREASRRKSALRAAEARLGGAYARLTLAKANRSLFMEESGGASISVELAAVEQAVAVVEMAKTELGMRTIRAPGDGTILQLNVRPGEYAQAGSASQSGASQPALVVMGRLDLLHVRVDIDESDIPRYDASGTATASLRGDADRIIQLRLVRVEPLVVPKRALSGQATERVDTRVMQAVYAIEATIKNIRPGQQVDVFIDVIPRQMNTTMAR